MPYPSTKLLVLVALAAAAVTVVVTLAPGVHFAYRSPNGHVALETAAGLIGLLAAFLLLSRFRRDGRAGDLLLACALIILAASTLCFAVAPAVARASVSATASWARVFADAAGIAVFALAALARPRTVRRRREATRGAVGAAIVVSAGAALVAALLAGHLPAPIDPALSPEASIRPRIAGAAGVEVAQLLCASGLAVAAVGFSRRARHEDDELLGWLAIASTFGALSRVHYFLFPSLYSPWVHTGDLLRLGYYFLILVAAMREIAAYQPRLAQAAVLEERRRIARDLHDGLSQEIAFVAGGLRSIGDGPVAKEEIAPLLDAADHALIESRQAIMALSSPTSEPLGAAVCRIARALGLRAGTDVEIDVPEDLDASPASREAVLGIAREALINALRHGQGRRVRVALRGGDRLHLAVRDDGAGFAAGEAARGGSFGLVTMRERAEAVGGELSVTSRPGDGTLVEAVLPR